MIELYTRAYTDFIYALKPHEDFPPMVPTVQKWKVLNIGPLLQ